MKRKTLGGLVVLAMFLSMATTVFGSDIRINNVKTSQSITTEIQNGYTMVPLRYISEQFGCEVSYNEEAKIAIVEKQEMSLKFPINSSTVYVNGTASQLDAPAFIKDNSTYVPLRFIVSTLGGTITYNEATKIININTNDGREVQADYFG
ncbi:MAG: copper amine oxidase N-terminal domain-containing protein, partial [Anaerotignaceae bacterium]